MDESSKPFPQLTEILKSYVHFAHININGLLKKLEQVQLLLKETQINVLAVSETQFSNIVSDTELTIPDYSFVREDRSGWKNHWGGVLIYYQSNIPSHEIELSFDTGITKTIWLDINFKAEKLFRGCIFIVLPMKKSLWKILNQSSTKSITEKNILILGDLNIDLLKPSTMSSQLKRLMYSSNFTNVIQDATRITAISSTLNDVALTSIPANVTNSGSFNTCISDHNLIFSTLQLSSKLPK